MKITQFDDLYTTALGFGGTTIVTGTSGGSNSGLGGDVTGSVGDLSVIGLRERVSLSSNMGDSTVGTVLTTISSIPWVAQFAVPSNSGASFGSNATRVSASSFVGASANSAREDHRHDGIGTVTASSSNTLGRGTLNIRQGNNVDLGWTDTDGDGLLDTVTINARAGASAGGASGVTTIAKSGSTGLTGAVTLTGGTNVTLTQSGNDISIAASGSGGTRAFGLDRASFDPTYGDDFTGASLDVKWSRQNQIAGQESYQQGGLASILQVAHGTVNAAEYIYQTAPNGTNETWEASCSWFQETSSLQMFAVLMVDGTGKGAATIVYDNTNGLYLVNVVAHTESSVVAQNINYKPTPTYYQSGGRIWLRLRKAGTTYAASYSIDGQIYSKEVSGTPAAFTPARVGIGRILGTTAGDIANWHWFDKTA